MRAGADGLYAGAGERVDAQVAQRRERQDQGLTESSSNGDARSHVQARTREADAKSEAGNDAGSHLESKGRQRRDARAVGAGENRSHAHTATRVDAQVARGRRLQNQGLRMRLKGDNHAGSLELTTRPQESVSL